jgi:hypothetical protein
MRTPVSECDEARALIFGLAALVLAAAVGPASAQESNTEPATGAESATREEHPAKEWSASASVHIYIVPKQTYPQPTLMADYKWLHLEARYNYEALETASWWLGYNFSAGKALWLDFKPMVGGVFGNTRGVAAGYELTLAYWKLELYSEGEYLFDSRGPSGNFMYTWSQFTVSPLDWVQIGVVTQRTHAYQTVLNIERGPLIGFSYKWFNVTASFFDLAQSQPTFVVGVGASF